MAWPFDQLEHRASELRGVATGLTVALGVTPAVWIMINGGLRRIRRNLSDHEREARKDAVPLLSKGLQIHSTPSDECIDSFVEALEILDASRSRLKSRNRAVKQAAWMIAGMCVSLAGMWTFHLLTTAYSVIESVIALAWFGFCIVYFVQGGPVAWQLLDRGVASAGERLSTSETAAERD